MAKLSSVNKNERRKKLVAKTAAKIAKLKAIANDELVDETERLIARLKMAELPRNGNPTRIRNRCELTGRSRGYYRKFRLSRIMLRELGNKGLIPGLDQVELVRAEDADDPSTGDMLTASATASRRARIRS